MIEIDTACVVVSDVAASETLSNKKTSDASVRTADSGHHSSTEGSVHSTSSVASEATTMIQQQQQQQQQTCSSNGDDIKRSNLMPNIVQEMFRPNSTIVSPGKSLSLNGNNSDHLSDAHSAGARLLPDIDDPLDDVASTVLEDLPSTNNNTSSNTKEMPYNDNSIDFELEEPSYQDMLRGNVRRMSNTLAELHVYIIPDTAWETTRGLASKAVVEDCVSIGFVRVLPDLTIADLRSDILAQLETDKIPPKFVYVRGVGRHFTEIRGKQEQLLKVRNFLPPQAQEPEIFLLEKLVASATEADAKLSNGGEASGHEAERLRLQEDLMKFKVQKRDGDSKREHLLNRARVLQTRALTHKAKLAGLWEEKLKDEQVKTGPLEEVCAALREALDAEHRRRMEAFETKMKPIIIRDGPSRKANHKIAAAKLYYDIYSMSQRLRLTTIRVEHEESKRERVEREVKRLRDEISVKKTTVTTVTKGIPVNKIEVRPQGQQPSYSGPTGVNNPIFAGLSAGAQASLSSGLPTSGPIMTEAPGSSIPGLPSLPGIGLPPELQQVSRSTPPPDRRGMPGLSSAGMMFPPRSAKISKEEAAAAAGGLASTKTDYNGTKGAGANARVPNGRPPQPIRIN